MCDSTYNKAIETKSMLLNKKDDLKLEIAKRREMLEKKLNSDTAKNKIENKVDKISSKIASVEEKIERTNQYYRDEITRARTKLESDLYVLRNKLEIQEKILNDKFDKYNEYCQSQMTVIEKKAELQKESLETVVEKLEKLSDIDEDADFVLTNLKIKLEQLDKLLEEATNTVWKEEALLEKRMKRMQEEQLLLCQQEQRRADEAKIAAAIKVAAERTREKEAEHERYMKRRELNTIVEIQEQKETEEEMKIRKKEERRLRKIEVDEFLSINNREEKLNNLTALQQKKYYDLPDNFIVKGKFLDAIK